MARSFSFALIAGLLFSVVIVINIIASSNRKTEDDHMAMGNVVKNLVLLVGSGLGPSGVTLARGFQESLRKGDASVPTTLTFEPYLTATLRTRSANSRVADAAAAATALATGKKTNNGMLAKDPQSKKDLISVLEMAQQAGLKTGLITTSELTGPVAAAFTSHMENLNMPTMVASNQLGAKLDLLMGGGGRSYSSAEGRWRNASYAVVKSADELQKVSALPVLGLFAEKDMEFTIDRTSNSKQPSLAQMTQKALDLLRNTKGFVLVVEAGNIDACADAKDAACLAHEVLALQESFDAVASLLAKTKDTVCIVVSDRDSGGLVLGEWDPSILASVKASAQSISQQINNADLDAIFSQNTGLTLTPNEKTKLSSDKSASAIGEVLSGRAGISWGGKDTGVDVNFYACGDSSADVPRGNVDNTAVGAYLMKKLPAKSSGSSHGGMDMGGDSGHGSGGHHHH